MADSIKRHLVVCAACLKHHFQQQVYLLEVGEGLNCPLHGPDSEVTALEFLLEVNKS